MSGYIVASCSGTRIIADWTRPFKVGQTCTPERQETILLSDILGISALVDAVNNPTERSATESSVLGPFYHEDAAEISNGGSITSHDTNGEAMLIKGSVRDLDGKPIVEARVDMWETNGNGFYDLQDPVRDGPDCRGTLFTDQDGTFSCMGVRSIDYPIPDDGPVGQLLRLLGRSNMRPAHVVRGRPVRPQILLGILLTTFMSPTVALHD